MATAVCFFHSASHVYPRFPYRRWNNGKLEGRKFGSLNFVGWKQSLIVLAELSDCFILIVLVAITISDSGKYLSEFPIRSSFITSVQLPAKPGTTILFTNMKLGKDMVGTTYINNKNENNWVVTWACHFLSFMNAHIDVDSSALAKTLICAVNKDAEKSFKKTVEVDRLIDMLRDADDKELHQLVVENVLAFNEGFWIRLAARTETCKSEDDKKDYEELAALLMSVVDRLVHKTNEKIESATDVLKAILKPVVNEEEEIEWPPRDPEALILMQKELNQREQEGHLDEGFLAEVNAQLRQAKEDGDKPGLEAMLQKVLQLYASRVLSKRSYAKKGNEVLKAEQFLETLIQAPEAEWNKLLINGLTVGKGDISPEELYAVVKKRIERTLIRTEGGSYQQRILTEYLKGIQARGQEIVGVLQGGTR
ncbi:hypothetical protein Sango_0890500 [Sesamum angolense]|uniref:Uncharacterized protein n=1 Tax=Sesamum angolense TaxID=2727404 RepID=A0AAE1WXK3_9LAMI|nr:hypothetical protein Sango_0890500 [Sesamum angolense]